MIFGINTESEFLSAVLESDAIVIVTAHKEFHDIDLKFLKSKMRSSIIIDSQRIINQHAAKRAGLIYRGIGCEKV